MDLEKFEKLVITIKEAISKYPDKKDIIKQYYEIGKLIIDNQNNFQSKEELLKQLSMSSV